jgi:hypothetical protein
MSSFRQFFVSSYNQFLGTQRIWCDKINVEMVTDAEFITLDRFTMRLAPTKRAHIGVWNVELKTKMTRRPFSIKFKVRVYCEPAIVKNVNCWKLVDESTLNIDYKSFKSIQINR